MQRICFTMRVDPARLERYEAMHRDAWPELLVALDESGWRNYSLFLRDDGFLVGYLESADWPASQAAMDAREVSARWSREMDRLVVPGSTMRWLPLRGATGSEPLESGASRDVRVGRDPVLPGPAQARTAVFEDPDGTVVVYAEDSVDAAAIAEAMLPTSPPAPFRRVFDLDRQLSALAER